MTAVALAKWNCRRLFYILAKIVFSRNPRHVTRALRHVTKIVSVWSFRQVTKVVFVWSPRQVTRVLFVWSPRHVTKIVFVWSLHHVASWKCNAASSQSSILLICGTNLRIKQKFSVDFLFDRFLVLHYSSFTSSDDFRNLHTTFIVQFLFVMSII